MTKNKRLLIYKVIVLAVALLYMLMPGVRDRLPQIDSRVSVTALGVDKSREGVKLTAAVSVAIKEGEGQTSLSVAQAAGVSLGDALKNLSRSVGKKVELAHCGLVAMGRELCYEGVEEIVEFLVTSGLISDGASLIGAESLASDLVEAASRLTGKSTFTLTSFIAFAGEDAQIPMVSLARFAANNNTVGKSAFLPVIKLGDGDGKGQGQESSQAGGQGGQGESGGGNKDQSGEKDGQGGGKDQSGEKDGQGGGKDQSGEKGKQSGGNKDQSGEKDGQSGGNKDQSGEKDGQGGQDKGAERNKRGKKGQNENDSAEQESQSQGADEGKATEGGKQTNIASSDRTLIFKSFKAVTEFDADGTAALSWLDPQSDRGTVRLDKFEFGGKTIEGLTFSMRKKGVKLKARFEAPDKPAVTVNISAKLETDDTHGLIELERQGHDRSEIMKALRSALVAKFDAQIMGGYAAAVRADVDPFKYSYALFKRDPHTYAEYEGGFQKLASRLKLTTSIKLLIV